MSAFISKFDDLVLDRRAVTRPDAFDFPGIERRPMQIIANPLVQRFARISNKTLDLILFDLFRRERECDRVFVWRLGFKGDPIYRTAIATWRRSGIQPSYLKTECAEIL